MTDEHVRLALSYGLPYIVAASICLAAGVIALALALLRSRDRLLLLIGAFACLYGLRLFLENNLVRFTLGVHSLDLPIALITYIIPLPFMLYLREVLDQKRQSLMRFWIIAQLVFAPIAIGINVISGPSASVELINNVMVIAAVLSIVVPLLIRRQGDAPPAMRYAILAFMAFAVANNVGVHPGGRNIEPIGFLILIAGLGYTAAQRAISREQKLAAVESELATARRIQTSILPRTLPELPGLRLAAIYRPMTAVAGDFYDFLRIDDRRLTVLVADVSGHGVPAALIASMLKIAFAQQSANATDPAAILSGINRNLSGVVDGQFVTAACAHIDLAAGQITYAGAGHPPSILVRRASGTIEELAENGLFLGPFRHAQYSNITVPFGPGDRLLLYTDGIIEATIADGDFFGAARLRDFASAHVDQPPATFAESLIQKVSIGEQEDDLTVVVAEAS